MPGYYFVMRKSTAENLYKASTEITLPNGFRETSTSASHSVKLYPEFFFGFRNLCDAGILCRDGKYYLFCYGNGTSEELIGSSSSTNTLTAELKMENNECKLHLSFGNKYLLHTFSNQATAKSAYNNGCGINLEITWAYNNSYTGFTYTYQLLPNGYFFNSVQCKNTKVCAKGSTSWTYLKDACTMSNDHDEISNSTQSLSKFVNYSITSTSAGVDGCVATCKAYVDQG